MADKPAQVEEIRAKIHQLNLEKQNRKFRFRVYLVLVTGVVLFFLPSLYSLYSDLKAAPARTIYEQQGKQPPQIAAAARYNRQINAWQRDRSKPQPQANFLSDQKAPIGELSIPAIKIRKMMVFHGDTDEILSRGIGNMPWTSFPVGGRRTRAVLTGHSGLANQVFFDNIKHLKRGDVVELSILGKRLAYEITGKRQVIDPKKPDAVAKFYVTDRRDRLTLMTCTPVFINNKRLLVDAKRVPLQALDRQVTRRDFWSLQHIWMMVVLLIVVLLLAFLLYEHRRSRRLIRQIEQQLESLSNHDEKK